MHASLCSQKKCKTRFDRRELTTWVQGDDGTMSDEELAASAIVQMTLFIAAQVNQLIS